MNGGGVAVAQTVKYRISGGETNEYKKGVVSSS